MGIFEGLSHCVLNYVHHAAWHADMAGDSLTVNNLPDLQSVRRLTLQPAQAYNFRVAGINTRGRGEFSEVRKSAILSFLNYIKL